MTRNPRGIIIFPLSTFILFERCRGGYLDVGKIGMCPAKGKELALTIAIQPTIVIASVFLWESAPNTSGLFSVKFLNHRKEEIWRND